MKAELFVNQWDMRWHTFRQSGFSTHHLWINTLYTTKECICIGSHIIACRLTRLSLFFLSSFFHFLDSVLFPEGSDSPSSPPSTSTDNGLLIKHFLDRLPFSVSLKVTLEQPTKTIASSQRTAAAHASMMPGGKSRSHFYSQWKKSFAVCLLCEENNGCAVYSFGPDRSLINWPHMSYCTHWNSFSTTSLIRGRMLASSTHLTLILIIHTDSVNSGSLMSNATVSSWTFRFNTKAHVGCFMYFDVKETAILEEEFCQD